MRTVSTALNDLLLGTTTDIVIAESVEIVLDAKSAPGIAAQRWTDHSANLTIAGVTYYTRAEGSTTIPLFERGRIRSVKGSEVSTLDLKILTGASVLLGTEAMTLAVTKGRLRGAQVKFYRTYMTSPGVIVDSLLIFSGEVDRYEVSNTEIHLTVTSEVARLNKVLPQKVVQPTCSNTLYDPATCKATKYLESGSILAGATTTSLPTSGLSHSATAGWFDRGVLTITGGGALKDERRVVLTHAGTGVLTISPPLASVPAAGLTFTVSRGCDRTMADCTGKFNNLINFRGFPYSPTPDEVV